MVQEPKLEDKEMLANAIFHESINTELKRKSNFLPLESRGNFIETFYELVLSDLKNFDKDSSSQKN